MAFVAHADNISTSSHPSFRLEIEQGYGCEIILCVVHFSLTHKAAHRKLPNNSSESLSNHMVRE